MRVFKLTFLLLILIVGVNVDALTNPLKYLGSVTTPYKDVKTNVNVIFSANVFEAFSYKLQSMADVIDNKKFNKNIPTVIYIHGWLSDGECEQSVMAIRSAYREQHKHNFIAIDWSIFARFVLPIPYKSSATKLKEICITIAEQLEQIRTRGYQDFYLVGHSLGGQCAGLIGRHLRKISNNQFVISKIYALDPAGPGFESKTIGYTGLIDVSVKGFDCISKSDADYVQVIHTNAGKLGVMKSIGHADFYPNGGEKQPGCDGKSCNHQFAWIFFQQSIKTGLTFWARQCDSFSDFMNDKCNNNSVAIMGYSYEKPEGKFFLRTHPNQFASSLDWDGINTKNFSMHAEDGSIHSPLEITPFFGSTVPDHDEQPQTQMDDLLVSKNEILKPRENNDL